MRTPWIRRLTGWFTVADFVAILCGAVALYGYQRAVALWTSLHPPVSSLTDGAMFDVSIHGHKPLDEGHDVETNGTDPTIISYVGSSGGLPPTIRILISPDVEWIEMTGLTTFPTPPVIRTPYDIVPTPEPTQLLSPITCVDVTRTVSDAPVGPMVTNSMIKYLPPDAVVPFVSPLNPRGFEYHIDPAKISTPADGAKKQLLCAAMDEPNTLSDDERGIIFHNYGRLPFDIDMSSLAHAGDIEFKGLRGIRLSDSLCRLPILVMEYVEWRDLEVAAHREEGFVLLGLYLGVIPTFALEFLKGALPRLITCVRWASAIAFRLLARVRRWLVYFVVPDALRWVEVKWNGIRRRR